MICPNCQYPDSHVVKSEPNYNSTYIIRRRECTKCGNRYTTHEKMRDPKQKRIEIRE